VAEVAHDVRAFEYSLQKLVLVAQVVDIGLFGLAKVLSSVSTNKLVLKTVDGPSDVSGKGTVYLSI